MSEALIINSVVVLKQIRTQGDSSNITVFFILCLSLLCVCVCVGAHTRVGVLLLWCTCRKVRGKLCGVISLLPPLLGSIDQAQIVRLTQQEFAPGESHLTALFIIISSLPPSLLLLLPPSSPPTHTHVYAHVLIQRPEGVIGCWLFCCSIANDISRVS